MRSWFVVVMATVAGGAAGSGSALWTYGYSPVNLQGLLATYDPTAFPEARLELENGPEFDFGVMARGQEQEHTFVIKNVGNDVLTLDVLDTSCACTAAEISTEDVAPGEFANVLVRWEAREAKTNFLERATLRTSDPTQTILTLEIRGTVRQIVRSEPPDFFLGTFSSKSNNSKTVKVFGYRDTAIPIASLELVNPSTARHFHVSYEPMDEDIVTQEKGAKCGVMIHLESLPGHQPGPVRQAIRVTLDVEDVRPFELPVRGEVKSDLRIYGGKHLSDHDPTLINLGSVYRSKGVEAKIIVVTTGPDRDSTELQVVEVDPDDVLDVTLDEPTTTNRMRRQTIMLRVPPDAPLVNRLGTQQGSTGRIVLNTNHPDTPRIEFRVRFAIVE